MTREISVIVPVYKAEKYIRQSIDSILCQTFTDFELILVDDGSPDSSPIICDDYAKKDSRVKVIHKPNGGPSSAVNAGILSACGEYLMFVDSDDWIEPDMLDILHKTARQGNYDIVICNHFIDSLNGSSKADAIEARGGAYTREELVKELFPSLIYGKVLGSRALPGSRWGKLFKKHLVTDNSIYRPEKMFLGEDWLLTLPAILDSSSICILKDSYLYHYRIAEGSITNTFNPNLLRDLIDWKNKMLDITLKKGAYDFSQQFDTLIISILIGCTRGLTERMGKVKHAMIYQSIKEICYHEETRRITKWNNIHMGAIDRIYLFLIKHKKISLIFVLNSLLNIYYRIRAGLKNGTTQPH